MEIAKIETWDGGGRAFDAVIAAQAWHWVDPVAGAEAAARVLRPGGRLAVFWNAFEPPPDLGEAMAAVFGRVLPAAPAGRRWAPGPDVYMTMGATAADGMRATGAFGEPEQWLSEWERRYTRDEWLEQVLTFGSFNLLPQAQAEDLLAGVGAAVDAVGGGFPMRYTTVAVTACCAGASPRTPR